MLPDTFSRAPFHEHSLFVDARNTGDARSARLIVSGDLDDLNAGTLAHGVLKALLHRPATLDLDVSGLTFLDTGGIRALLQCHTDAAQAGCRLTLTDPHPNVRRVLEIVGLLDQFGLADS